MCESRKEKLECIAERYNLHIVDVTPNRNGFPSNLSKALIGFKTMDELKDIVKVENLDCGVCCLFKKYGWDIWAHDGWTNQEIDIIGHYSEEPNGTCIFNEEDLRSKIANACESFAENEDADIDDFFDEMWLYKKMKVTIDNLDDDTFIWYHDKAFDEIPEHAMQYDDESDSKKFAIGIILF